VYGEGPFLYNCDRTASIRRFIEPRCDGGCRRCPGVSGAGDSRSEILAAFRAYQVQYIVSSFGSRNGIDLARARVRSRRACHGCAFRSAPALASWPRMKRRHLWQVRKSGCPWISDWSMTEKLSHEDREKSDGDLARNLAGDCASASGHVLLQHQRHVGD
jgi:hypothetical protein